MDLSPAYRFRAPTPDDLDAVAEDSLADPVFEQRYRALLTAIQDDPKLAAGLLDRSLKPWLAATKQRLRTAQQAEQIGKRQPRRGGGAAVRPGLLPVAATNRADLAPGPQCLCGDDPARAHLIGDAAGPGDGWQPVTQGRTWSSPASPTTSWRLLTSGASHFDLGRDIIPDIRA
jgi:hypothetical protein